MIRVLITGKSSYIGNALRKWLQQDKGQFEVEMVSIRDKSLEELSFQGYDIIVHMAGIAHISAKKSMEEEYYRINRDLTIKTAKKAKEEGVKQFIFLSSIIVYGENRMGRKKIYINNTTKPKPDTYYGESKLQAEEGILSLQDGSFKITIVRAPMVYGRNAKGNYRKLMHLAKKTIIFPKISNERSMIYIDNLCEFLRLLIIHRAEGIFCPQNKETVNTTSLVKEIAFVNKRRIIITSLLNPLIWLLGHITHIVYKAFGSQAYEREMSAYFDYQYCVVGFKESIRRSNI